MLLGARAEDTTHELGLGAGLDHGHGLGRSAGAGAVPDQRNRLHDICAVSPASRVSPLTGSCSSTLFVTSSSANGDSLIGLVATFVGETDKVWLTGGEVAWGMLQRM